MTTIIPGYAASYPANTAPALPPPPPSYTGPLDIAGIPAPLGAWSTRALTVANLGQPLFSVRRDSDNATQNILAITSGANIAKADQGAAATFAGSAHLFLKSWFDQGPNGYNTKSTNVVDAAYGAWSGENALQPGYVASALATCPAFDSFGNTDPSLSGYTETQVNVPMSGGVFTVFVVATNVAGSGPFTWDVYNNSTPGSGVHYGPPQSNSMNWGIRFAAGTNLATWSSGANAPPGFTSSRAEESYTNDGTGSGTFSYYEFVFTGAAGDAAIMNTHVYSSSVATTSDGVNESSNTSWPLVLFGQPKFGLGTPPPPGGMMSGGSGRMIELMIFASALTAPQRDSIRQNIGTFFGLSVAP